MVAREPRLNDRITTASIIYCFKQNGVSMFDAQNNEFLKCCFTKLLVKFPCRADRGVIATPGDQVLTTAVHSWHLRCLMSLITINLNFHSLTSHIFCKGLTYTFLMHMLVGEERIIASSTSSRRTDYSQKHNQHNFTQQHPHH